MGTILTKISGFLLIFVGFFVFLLPIPLGAIMMTVGFVMVFGQNPKVLNRLRRLRIASNRFNKFANWLTRYSPGLFHEVLVATSPEKMGISSEPDPQ